MAVSDQIDESLEDLDAWILLGAVLTGLFPAIGAYITIGLAVGPIPWLFLVLWLIFAVAFSQKHNFKHQIGAGVFWLAIEAFLFPIAILVFAFVFVTEQTNPFAAAGGAIGGGILFIVSWFIAWLVGVVLYLISNRFES